MDDTKIFEALGFCWDRRAVLAVPNYGVKPSLARFSKMLPQFVWHDAVLENNPYTFVEIKTLLDGVTVGGRKVSDEQQILNLAESSKKLIFLVKSASFKLDYQTYTSLHALVARDEALEWGCFRGEGEETRYTPGVALGERGTYTPLATEPGGRNLRALFERGVSALETCTPWEKGLCFSLFGALQQFFFDGNKRTSRMMMNGVLMSGGYDAISIPASMAGEYNEKMIKFYLSKDGTEMLNFMQSIVHRQPTL